MLIFMFDKDTLQNFKWKEPEKGNIWSAVNVLRNKPFHANHQYEKEIKFFINETVTWQFMEHHGNFNDDLRNFKYHILLLHFQLQTLDENLCSFEVNRTYAVVSSTISFWLPAVVMIITYWRIYVEATKQEQHVYR